MCLVTGSGFKSLEVFISGQLDIVEVEPTLTSFKKAVELEV